MLSPRNQIFLFKIFILPTIFAPILLLPFGLLFSGCPQLLLTLAKQLASECPTDRRHTSLLSCDLKQEKVDHQLQQRHETSLSLTDRAIKTDACFASSQNTNRKLKIWNLEKPSPIFI
jgi:hypothetical protein